MFEKYRIWSRTDGARDLAVAMCLLAFMLMGMI